MNVGPLSKALVNFAGVDFVNSIIWNHEFCSCLLKSRGAEDCGRKWIRRIVSV